jgi:hypothetical protein
LRIRDRIHTGVHYRPRQTCELDSEETEMILKIGGMRA